MHKHLIESPLWKLTVDYGNFLDIFLSLKNVGYDFFYLITLLPWKISYAVFRVLAESLCTLLMQWNPPTLAEVTTEMLDDIFAPFHRGEKELDLPVEERESRLRRRSRL